MIKRLFSIIILLPSLSVFSQDVMVYKSEMFYFRDIPRDNSKATTWGIPKRTVATPITINLEEATIKIGGEWEFEYSIRAFHVDTIYNNIGVRIMKFNCTTKEGFPIKVYIFGVVVILLILL